MVDEGQRRIILAVLVTPGEVMDNHPMLDLLWHTCFRWHLWPDQVTADSLYGTGENLKAIEEAHIRAYIPIAERGQYNMGYYGLAQFTYDASQDLYRCPQGQVLRPAYRMEGTQEIQYRADAATCNACPVKAQCTESPRGRHVHRSFFADYVERVKGYQQTPAYQKALNKRKVWVEPLFAEAKDWHGLRRFRLRLLRRVNCEALCIATGQNLKRLLQKRGWGRRPFPSETVTVVPYWEEEDPFKRIKGNSQRRRIAVALIDAFSLIRMLFAHTKEPVFSAYSRPYAFSISFLVPRPCSFPPLVLIFPLNALPGILKLMRSLVSSATEFFNRLGRFCNTSIKLQNAFVSSLHAALLVYAPFAALGTSLRLERRQRDRP